MDTGHSLGKWELYPKPEWLQEPSLRGAVGRPPSVPVHVNSSPWNHLILPQERGLVELCGIQGCTGFWKGRAVLFPTQGCPHDTLRHKVVIPESITKALEPLTGSVSLRPASPRVCHAEMINKSPKSVFLQRFLPVLNPTEAPAAPAQRQGRDRQHRAGIKGMKAGPHNPA